MIKALTRKEVVDTGWNGDAELIDFLTGISFTIRGSRPLNYNHSDFQTRTKEDTAKMRKAAGSKANWTPRPALWKYKNFISAVAYHSYNHSVVVASPADNIVGPPNITRATQQDAKGNWIPGHHFCMHYIDSIDGRTKDNWTIQMNNAVKEAVQLANINAAPKEMTVTEAVKIWQAAGVMASPDYWLAAVVSGTIKYLGDLIINAAKKGFK